MSSDLDLTAVAATGDRIATLRALRNRLAQEIEQCDSSRDFAALSRQLTLVMLEIDELALSPAKDGNPLDVLSARRAARTSRGKNFGGV